MEDILSIITFIYLILLIFLIYVYLYGGFNNIITKKEIKIKDKKVKSNFKIALLTDIHSSKYTEKEIIKLLKKENPDLIFLAGDIIDSRVSVEEGIDNIKEFPKLAKTYYVTGNHEAYVEEEFKIKEKLKKLGIIVLEGDFKKIKIAENDINIFGYDDSSIGEEIYEKELENIKKLKEEVDEEDLNLLISHRPEKDEEYKTLKMDYVFSGHAHGGQWRLYENAKRGFYAPGQGFFPKLIDGIYDKENYKIIVSAGLAKDNTKIPRIFNNPSYEIIKFEKMK